MTGSRQEATQQDLLEQAGLEREYIGLDPGSSGAIALVNADGTRATTYTSPGKDMRKWLELIERIKRDHPHIAGAFLERANAGAGNTTHDRGKGQGKQSLMTQGAGIGHMEMAGTIIAGTPPVQIIPMTWTTRFCLKRGKTDTTKDWKETIYERAKEYYPDSKFPKLAGDAVMIAEMCRRYDGKDPVTRRPKKKKPRRRTATTPLPF